MTRMRHHIVLAADRVAHAFAFRLHLEARHIPRSDRGRRTGGGRAGEAAR